MERAVSHLVLICGVVLMLGPVLWWGGRAVVEMPDLWTLRIGFEGAVGLTQLGLNSVMIAIGVALLSTTLAFLTAYVLVFEPVRGARAVFWLSMLTLLFPIEARLIPTREVLGTLGLAEGRAALILPVLNFAVGTFYFRQVMRGLDPDLLGAARLDGAGRRAQLVEILAPALARPIGAVAAITFVIGWNQYVWPLMLARGPEEYTGLVAASLLGIGRGTGQALALAMTLPPLLLAAALMLWPSPERR